MPSARAGIVLVSLWLASCLPNHVSFPTGSLGSPYTNPTLVSGPLFMPTGNGPFPAVVLLHTCGGLRPHVTDDWPNYLTGQGYAVLSVDSYGPRGATSCTKLPGGAILQAEDAFGALDYLATLPRVDATRVGVMGFSAGAIAINSHLVGAWKKKPGGRYFKAAIALYGHCRQLYEHTRDSIPLMEIIPEYDKNLAPSCIRVAKDNPTIELQVLAGAHHAFDQDRASGREDPFGNYMDFSIAATARARELTKAFLAKNLGSQGMSLKISRP